MNILLINSDLAKNRGDRAIAEGVIELIRNRFPDANITGLSEKAARDRKWFGIDFLNIDSQSLQLRDFLALRKAAKRADIILWGGGEILKDYTNKLALWYWSLKMWAISRVNPRIYGAYQGIGPTSADFSKKLIVRTVKRCEKFIVRDHESYEKLVAWGVPADKLISSSDPAVLPKPQALSAELKQKLQKDFDIDEAFLDNFVSFGPRSWFHYKRGGLVPFRYKKALLKFFGKTFENESEAYVLYKARLVRMVNDIICKYGNVLLTPMHMSESDRALCQYIRDHSDQPEHIRTLDNDSLSPAETRALIARAKAAVGFRLHSTIISTSCGVPSLTIYYVDKGRVFFDQIGQSHFAIPIERVLDKNFLSDFDVLFKKLMDSRASIHRDLEKRIDKLRDMTHTAFQEAMRDV